MKLLGSSPRPPRNGRRDAAAADRPNTHRPTGGQAANARCEDASCVGGPASSSGGLPEGSPRGSESEVDERSYVQAVLGCYVSLPGTASVTSRHDRRCARALFQRGVLLGVVKAAMVVAIARRTFRTGDPLPRVRALHFFLPIIDELLEEPCDPSYVGYLESKLRPLTAAKLRSVDAGLARPQRDAPGRGSPHPLREASSSRGR